jgi:hypothetical protein
MHGTRTALGILVTTALLVGCSGTRCSSHTTPTAADIEALIEKLAISQAPAAEAPVFTPSRDTPRTDSRVIAYEAAEELKKCGKAAFPHLLEHLDDKRQSVAFRRGIPHDVGDACFCIIREQVFCLPEGYEGSFYRTGADGRLHERPYFLKTALFDRRSVKSWLDARRDKSLEEIQVEALRWLIQQERQIGFPSEQDKQRYLYPLERQLARIERRLRRARPQ